MLYKQKKYQEALEPLKKAAADEDEGNHLEIWDHLGDCYLALGQKKDAIAASGEGAEDGGRVPTRRGASPQGKREAEEAAAGLQLLQADPGKFSRARETSQGRAGIRLRGKIRR